MTTKKKKRVFEKKFMYVHTIYNIIIGSICKITKLLFDTEKNLILVI